MDALDVQLAKLKLLNSRPLSPRIYASVPSSSCATGQESTAAGAASVGGNSAASDGGSTVAALTSHFQSPRILIPGGIDNGDQLSKVSPGGVSPKKVGPIVPPKPNKKQQPTFPEVPQSILVKQTCEPLYSKRLQSNGNGGGGGGGGSVDGTRTGILQQQHIPAKGNQSLSSASRPPILHRKQPAYATQSNVYSNNSKVTLDNPAILDQQLEALAHHKKQLEKKGLLMHQQHNDTSIMMAPKLSSSSYLSDLNKNNNGMNSNKIGRNPSPQNVVYSNVRQVANNFNKNSSGESANVYCNIAGGMPPHQQQYRAGNNSHTGENSGGGIAYLYSNIQYGACNEIDDLPPPPPAALSINTANPAEYLSQCHQQNDEDIPPPPSPVSSSYSELRRATDIFPKLPLTVQVPAVAPITQQHQQQTHAHPLQAQPGSMVSSSCMSTGSSGSAGKIHHHHQHHLHHQHPAIGGGTNSGLGLTPANPKVPTIINNGSLASTAGTVAGGQNQTYINMAYHHNNDYSTYGESPSSQGSSTYESIYEPINPRPPSQLSGRSNYLMYAPYVNGPQVSDCGSSGNLAAHLGGSTTPLSSSSGGGGRTLSAASGNHPHHSQQQQQQQPTNGKSHSHKEAEVEALTDLLVHSMDASNDADNYGVCVTCNERVVGENSGCTAMDQIFHIACFTCSQCQINLQGKPFYALEGKPYCEYDYLQTLEKCSVCMKPILERILRATGKPYHPQCFTCVVCGNSLDGIPFTVDATNQNYCIEDFHKKFAPRCCVCKMPIMPEPGQEETVRVVALDRSFHFECYKCEDCGLLLSSEAEGRGCYPLDDHVLCKSCNAKRVQTLTNRMTTEL